MEGLYTSVHTTLFYYGTESITEKKNYWFATNSITASRTPFAAWLGTPLSSSSSSSLSSSTSPSNSSPRIIQMLWSTQHAMMVFGILQWSSSKHFSSALHLPFNKPNACSETIRALESSLMNFFWSQLRAPLSLITGRSQVFNGYAESPSTSGQITVPPKSRVGSMRMSSFSVAQYTSLSRSIWESCRLLGNPVATDKKSPEESTIPCTK